MFEIIIADKAKQDIRNSLEYIKNNLFNPKAATELADMLESEISSLSQFPLSGAKVPDQFLSDLGFRFLLIKKYKVYYIADENKKRVNIIRFLHASRDYETILTNTIQSPDD